MERRDFLRSVAVTGVAGLAGAGVAAAQTQATAGAPTDSTNATRPDVPGMLYRELGRTGERVSAIGMGGYHLGKDPKSTQAEMVALVRSAIDQGVTFMDNCWDYNDGISEVRLGQALRDGYRQKAFVMTKMDGRTKAAYNKQLEESLGRLHTDVIDLVQFHEVIRMEDPDRIFAEGGAIEAAVEARKAGKIRYIGFTGHKDPQVHLRMFEIAAQHGFHFDTVQMPVNVMDAHFRSFAHAVIPVAQKNGTAVLAMKTFGDNHVLQSNTVQPIEALHYSLTQPVAVVITGMESQKDLAQAVEAARTFRPMSEAEVSALLRRTEQAAMTGKYEPFKTSNMFDGTAANPKWLG